jgi:tungstate transport system substrate-binding protein
VLAVGSGEALALAGRGDADVVLAHSPAAEMEFITAGHGESRREVMFNDFVLVGPPEDPAGVARTGDAVGALARVFETGALFVSRGDNSGTHAREQILWASAHLKPSGSGYVEAGQGMGAVLMMASEKRAYTLTDRGTYLNLRAGLDLVVLMEGDPALTNQYAIIVARGAANLEGARALADWLTSSAAQTLIGEFGVERFGRSLFVPNAAPIAE